jgi:hypothetical protein
MTIWQDNFDDNYLDPAKWEKVKWWNYTPLRCEVYERNQRLEIDTEAEGVTWVSAGVVSRDRYDLTKGKVSAYFFHTIESGQEIGIVISPHKTTTTNPLRHLPDFYAVILQAPAEEFQVLRRIAGGDVEIFYRKIWDSNSNKLRIDIQAGFIRFYEGDTLRTYDVYRLPGYECYIYISRYATAGCCMGIGWADDFYCEYCGTTEEKEEAKTELVQQQIAEWMRSYWVPLSVIGIVLAIVFAIIMGLI